MNLNPEVLIGKKVQNKKTYSIGTIVKIENGRITVSFLGEEKQFLFPEAFCDSLSFENSVVQRELESIGLFQAFKKARAVFREELDEEISFLKRTGGKKYQAFDGILTRSTMHSYIYDTGVIT